MQYRSAYYSIAPCSLRVSGELHLLYWDVQARGVTAKATSTQNVVTNLQLWSKHVLAWVCCDVCLLV